MGEVQKVTWGYGTGQFGPQLFVKYRLTLEMYKKMWALQDGKCAGCLVEFAHPLIKDLGKMGAKPEVDHDHKTGEVRGLLCRKCNDFLGKVQDNHEVLERLYGYLRAPPRSRV